MPHDQISLNEIASFPERHSLTVAQARHVLSLSANGWSALKATSALDPALSLDLRDICRLVRLLDRYPQLLANLKELQPETMYSFLGEHGFEVSFGDFALIFGREKSAGSRWMNGRDGFPSRLQSLARCIMACPEPQVIIGEYAKDAGLNLHCDHDAEGDGNATTQAAVNPETGQNEGHPI